ncbi:preprotein translocase subunit SecG [Candidatus Dojkabacteria bacterium]|uniref:Protein-export membrane protein SecG n=1 Tax=Candidatus Dojkabacteria bacterium TaxID=2099670 RepID=A0A955RI42_9BACT|nr:preprotein translocase subunit SecG [Candidatus Dojkabacteria bacterium]
MSSIEVLTILQIVLALILVVSILLQSRGSGLGTVFGGSGGGAYRSKRGIEKLLQNVTIVSGILFGLNALAIFYLNGKV